MAMATCIITCSPSECGGVSQSGLSAEPLRVAVLPENNVSSAHQMGLKNQSRHEHARKDTGICLLIMHRNVQ